jgi:putative CocE/NonD family hydrolase
VTASIDHRLPEPRYENGEFSDLLVEMRDGIRLMTHVWLPKGEGPWPVIFLRNPYVDGGDIRDPALMVFVRYGYAVVFQECRGRGASEGVWEPFVNERQDGLDTLAWLIEQEWQDGNIGLYGGSYLSFNQWILADELPPQVKTLYISVLGTDQNRFVYMNGMFRHDIYSNWAISNAGVDWGDRDLNEVAYKAAYPFRPPIEMDEQLLGKKLSWYRSFLANPGSGDPLWQDGLWDKLRSIPSKVSIPVCMAGG